MKIMLACCLGMSTSVVVQKMKDAAKRAGARTMRSGLWIRTRLRRTLATLMCAAAGPAGAPSAAQGQGNCG